MLREEAAKRRGKFFACPVSGPGQRVQVIKAKTGTRGAGECPPDKKSERPASVPRVSFETSRRAIFLKAFSKGPGINAASPNQK